MSFFLYILLSLIEYSFYICSKQLSNRYNITLVFSNSPIYKLCNLISNLTKDVIMTSKCIYFYFNLNTLLQKTLIGRDAVTDYCF